MKQRLILLTDRAYEADLRARLEPFSGPPGTKVVTNLSQLNEALNQGPARLICCGSGVIVSSNTLRSLSGPAYNFHPGPPEYRGLFPSVFALYDNAETFGVTCHEMTEEIDAGPIVGLTRFPISRDCERAQLDALTYRHLLQLVEKLAPQLIQNNQIIPRSNEVWSGPLRRKADFEALCRLPANIDQKEFARRYRAIGEGPHHALSLELHGRIFSLQSRSDAPVTRGGKAI